MRRAVVSFAVALVLTSTTAARANEEVVRLGVTIAGDKLELETTIFSDGKPGKHPLALVLHGTPRSSDGLKAPRWRPTDAAAWLVERGFTVAVPMRRGYAGSDGSFSESFGVCTAPDYERAGRATAADARAALDALRARPELDVDRTLLIGHSGGGFGALAFASAQPKEVLGVINFSGGRGSVVAGAVCAPEKLIEATKHFGATTKVRSLWVYAANDQAFSPWLAQEMFAAFGTASRPKLLSLAAFGTDGHATLSDASAVKAWSADAAKFVRELGF